MNLNGLFKRKKVMECNEDQKLFNGKLRPKHVDGIIDKLRKDEIFVFGSNLDGYHGGGAAYLAFKKFGAVWGRESDYKGRVMQYLQCREVSVR